MYNKFNIIYSIAITEASSGPVQLDAPELTATPSNNTITLIWDAISNASSYTIQYADNAEFTGATTINNATSPKEISGLTNGTTYYFKALTVGNGTTYLSSDYSPVVSATPNNISSITITQDDLSDFTNSYKWYDWSSEGISGRAYAYKNAGMQFNSSKDGYWIYNSTAIPGIITSVKMVKASGTDRSWTLKAGTSEIASTNDGTQIGDAETVGTSGATWNVSGTYNYFLLYVSGGSTVISSIEITYIPSTDPVIVASDPAALAYDATGGEFGYSITNPTSATLNATSNCDWITNVSVDGTNSKVTFSTSTNTAYDQRTGTITLSYTGADNKVITITQAAAPVTYTTIPDLFAAATGTETNVNVTFDGWVVSGVHNNNVFLTDNQGNGLIIYTSNHGFAVNDKLSGTVSETPLKLFNGSAEFTNLTASTSGLTVTKDGEITVITNKTIAELGGVNTGAVITLSNLTYDGTNLSDGTNTIKPYNTLYSDMSLTSGKTYNITGVYQQYSNTKEILPRSAADIVEVQVQHNEYDLTVSNLENVEMFVFDAADDSNSLLDGEGTVQVYDGTEVMISVSAESGYELESLTVDGEDVTSQIDDSGAYTFIMPTHAVTVTATAVAVTPPTPVSGKYVKVTSTNDLTDGQYLIVYEDGSVAFDGGLETLDAASNTISVTISNNEIAATSVTTAAEFTIDVTAGTIKSASGKYIGQTSDANGLASNAETSYENNISIDEGNADIVSGGAYLRYNSANNQLRFRYFKSSTYSAQKAIQLYKKVESVTVTNAGYATYCSENALDFTDTDIKAYVGTKNGDKLTFTSINQVPANTGMLLVYAGGKTEDVPVIASATAVEDNCLVGVNEETTISSNDYILNKVNDGVGFYKAGEYTTLGAHKAYIPAAVGNGVKGFTIDFDDDATGLERVQDVQDVQEAIYNLAGQRLNKMQKGINIVNGKKILK